MKLFSFLSQYLWLIFIVFTFVNAGIVFKRTRKHVKNNPDLDSGYKSIIKGFVILGNIPWLIMGSGILSGEVSSIWIYLIPMNGSFFVIAFHMSIFTIFSLVTYWLFLKNGAELLTTHPGIFNQDLKSTHKVKLIWFLGLIFGLVSFVMMLFADIPQVIL